MTPADIDIWARIAGTLSEWFAPVLALPWSRLAQAPLGIQFYLGTLVVGSLLTGLAASGCIWRKLDDPKPSGTGELPPPKKRFGLKTIALLLVAILPGGLVGSVAILSLLGKSNWRSNAVTIFEFSLIPTLGLIWLDFHVHSVPIPELIRAAQIELEMFFGFTGAFMHFWITVKYLKQYWSEPDDRLPWWPPVIWWIQIVQGAAIGYYYLGTAH